MRTCLVLDHLTSEAEENAKRRQIIAGARTVFLSIRPDSVHSFLQLNRMAGVSPSGKSFTPKQGQYLAFIHLYTRLHRRAPAETDMRQYFRVSPPSVHQMVLTLERAGFIRRQPRTARSIELLVDPKQLPELL
jgi:hypothetical protein